MNLYMEGYLGQQVVCDLSLHAVAMPKLSANLNQINKPMPTPAHLAHISTIIVIA